jgi:hypothetical protein
MEMKWSFVAIPLYFINCCIENVAITVEGDGTAERTAREV